MHGDEMELAHRRRSETRGYVAPDHLRATLGWSALALGCFSPATRGAVEVLTRFVTARSSSLAGRVVLASSSLASWQRKALGCGLSPGQQRHSIAPPLSCGRRAVSWKPLPWTFAK